MPPVGTGVLPKDGQAYELAFDATRGGFAKLTVLDNYGGSAVRLRNFDLRGAPRFGGLVSMLEGGASVERVTVGMITQAGRAISYEEKGLSLSAPAGTSLVVNLTQDLHVIDRIRLQSTRNTSALKELELRVSASGSADSDFITALVATLPQDGLVHAFTFPPVSARFVQLISRSSYGSTTVTIANFQVFARDVGGRTLSFEDRSQDLDGQLVTYRWDFGDGTGSSEPNPTHLYANSGTYRITLEVTDDTDLSASQTLTYQALLEPIADFDWSPVAPRQGQTVTLTSRSDSPNGAVAYYDWHVSGDWDVIGTTNHNPSLPYNLQRNNVLKATLRIVDGGSLSSVRSNTAAVSNIPPSVASGPGVDRYWGQEDLFTGNSVSDPSDVTTCEIDWGDGSAAASGCPSNTLSHAYSEPGVYEAVFGAYDGDVTSKDSREVRVHRRHPPSSFCPRMGSRVKTSSFAPSSSMASSRCARWAGNLSSSSRRKPRCTSRPTPKGSPRVSYLSTWAPT